MSGFLSACQTAPLQIPIVLTHIDVEIKAPQEIAVNPETGYIYIINSGSQVAVLKDFEEVALLETTEDHFSELSDLAIDTKQNWVYVVDKYQDSVTVIQNTEIVKVIPINGREPQDVAINPQNGWAYVVGPYRKNPPHGEISKTEGHITVLNGPEVIGTLILPDIAIFHVVADPVNGYIYVGGTIANNNPSNATLSDPVVIVIKELHEVTRFTLNYHHSSMDVDPRTGDVFIADGKNLYKFSEGKLVETVLLEPQGYIRNLKVHPTTGGVYMVNWGDKTEAIIVRDGEVIAHPAIGPSSLKMDIDPLSGNVYIADFWHNTLTVLHDTEVIATLETGFYPYGIAVNPTNGLVYVSNTNEGTISVFGIDQPEN